MITKKQVIKETKQGKWALICAILGIVSIPIFGFLIFWPIAVILYFIGKKRLKDQPAIEQAEEIQAEGQSEMEQTQTERSPQIKAPAAPGKTKFKPKTRINGLLLIDEKNSLWSAPKCKSGRTIYRFEDLLNFSLVEDGNTATSGGRGAAVVGGLAFGAVGAIVGGVTGKRKTKETCRKMQIVINVNSLKKPTLFINLIDRPTKKASKDYEKAFQIAQTIIGALNIISTK